MQLMGLSYYDKTKHTKTKEELERVERHTCGVTKPILDTEDKIKEIAYML